VTTVLTLFRSATAEDTEWHVHALCRGKDPEIFYPVGTKGPAILQAEEAKAICRRCPVRAECYLDAEANNEIHGVFGGRDWDPKRAENAEKATR
jgi:WhiB family redox-sensing transcriptional regulator